MEEWVLVDRDVEKGGKVGNVGEDGGELDWLVEVV